ncbi:MAG: transcriptional regulator [marine bacterium B5-7]|nr:MAG: transcriptional regulator [marine bacterium B5-7]
MDKENHSSDMESGDCNRLQNDDNAAPRIKDVAFLADVSTATVSRVLNQPHSVTETLRNRVLKAVGELDYVPHGAARALASRRSRTIGAIVPTIDNAIFATSLQYLQARLSGFGYTLLLASSDYNLEREHKECQTLVEKGIDGMILVGEARGQQTYEVLVKKHIPYINIWIYNPDSPHPCIGFDNYGAAYQLAEYLMDIGHRKIAMVAGINEGNDRAVGRSTGIRDALASRNLKFHNGFYEERPYSIEDGRNTVSAWLSHSSPPTAIACGNDILALGVLFECISRKIRVPEDMSITGFDGIELSAHVTPALTTVSIPSAQIGTLAANYLVARLEDKTTASKTRLSSHLVIRDTTAPPRID